MTLAPGDRVDDHHRDRLTEALRTIERLQDRLRAGRSGGLGEPIAIVGIGCRLPGECDSPEAFWRLLRDGVDAVGEFPAERDGPGRSAGVRGGFLHRVGRFEPEVFEIPQEEARGIGPEQRLALEVAWEALERAGYAPDGLAARGVGVYLGVSATNPAEAARTPGAADTVGGPRFAAERISHTLGLQGPSKVIDTSCSSSLVALHEACQALRLGECEMALAGGVTLLSSPDAYAHAHGPRSALRAVSPDGRCKAFDAGADGFGPGEGAAVVVLKRYSDALRDGDHVSGLIRGSAVNHDGRGSAMTAPNLAAQRQVIKSAMERAGSAPDEIDYVEAHGTGTPAADPVELRALAEAIGLHRSGGRALPVGSVKTNIGDLGAAAGVAGLLKLVLALQHGEIPPHLHFTTPNPNVDWDRLNIEVTAAPRPWPETGHRPRTGAVSSFGAAGTNAHCVVSLPEEPAGQEEPDAPETPETPGVPGVLVASAHTREALAELARAYAQFLRDRPDIPLADVCHTAQVGRARAAHGLAATGDCAESLAGSLEAYAAGVRDPRLTGVRLPPHGHRRVAWLFAGEDVGFAGPVRGLAAEPAFREAYEDCAELFDKLAGPEAPPPPADGPGVLLAERRRAQRTLFCVEYALARLWLAWGPPPAALIGYGTGEIAAACVAGVFGLEDAVRLTAARAALPLDPTDADLAAYAAVAGSVGYAPPSLPLVSPATGLPWADPAEGPGHPGYWVRQATAGPDAARFHDGVSRLHADGLRTFLEVGPSPALPALDYPPTCDPRTAWIASLRRPGTGAAPDDATAVRLAAGALHLRGARLDWAAVRQGGPARRVPLPVTVWRGTCPSPVAEPPAPAPGSAPGSGSAPAPGGKVLLGLAHRMHTSVPMYEVKLDDPLLEPYARTDSRGRRYLPLGALATVGMAAASDGLEGRWSCVEELVFYQRVPLDGDGRIVQIMLTPDDSGHAVLEARSTSPAEEAAGAPWRLHVRGVLRRRLTARPRPMGLTSPLQVHRYDSVVPYESAYLSSALVDAVTGAHRGGGGVLVALAPERGEGGMGWVEVLDAAVAALSWDAGQGGAGPGEAGFASHLADLICEDPQAVRYVRAVARSRTATLAEPHGEVIGEVEFFAEDGSHVGGVRELRVVAASVVDTPEAPWRDPDELLHRVEWQPADPPPAPAGPLTGESLLLFPDRGGVAARLAGELRERGARCLVAAPEEAADGPRAVAALVARWREGLDEGAGRVLVLTGLDTPRPEDADTDALYAFHRHTELTLIALVQELIGRQDCSGVPVSLVTRGAVPAGPEPGVSTPFASPLWGLGRVIAVEHPGHWGGLIDLDPAGPPADDMALLTAALLDAGQEGQQALRGPGRRVARLVSSPLDPAELAALPEIRPSGAYLITGAFGSAGRMFGRWLAENGAGKLVLLGRTELPRRSQWDLPRHPPGVRERIAAVRELEATGVLVEVVTADVGDITQMLALMEQLAVEPCPLRGIVHAAGVSGARPLADIRIAEPADYEIEWRTKVVGGWLLHQLTEGLDLDFFLGFSSVAATLGAPGLAGYAAGNAFLEGLAEYRRGLSQPALAVGWGPWEHVGAPQVHQDITDALRTRGVRLLAAPQCLKLLAALLAGPDRSAVVSANDRQPDEGLHRGIHQA